MICKFHIFCVSSGILKYSVVSKWNVKEEWCLPNKYRYISLFYVNSIINLRGKYGRMSTSYINRQHKVLNYSFPIIKNVNELSYRPIGLKKLYYDNMLKSVYVIWTE